MFGSKIITNSRNGQKHADVLVNPNFDTHLPNKLWVADLSYIKTMSSWVYTAFIVNFLPVLSLVEKYLIAWILVWCTISYMPPFEFEKRYDDSFIMSGIATWFK